MTYIQRSWAHFAVLILALVGVGISIYLTAVHYQDVPLVCSTTGLIDCSRVLASSFSVVPGTQIPISLPGLGWFIVAAALAGTIVWRPALRAPRLALLGWSILGMLTVLYLVYVEIVRLGSICIWCTTLHVFIFAILLISATQLQTVDEEEEEFDEEEEPSVVKVTRE